MAIVLFARQGIMGDHEFSLSGLMKLFSRKRKGKESSANE